MDERVAQMNQAGQGYKPQREAAGEIGKWRKEVTRAEAAAANAVFATAGLDDFLSSGTR